MNFLSTPHSSPASVVALSFDLARALPAQAKPAPAPDQVYDLGSLTDDAAVHDNLLDALGDLVRLFVGRRLVHAREIEDDEIGEGACLHHAAVPDAERLGGERRHRRKRALTAP